MRRRHRSVRGSIASIRPTLHAVTILKNRARHKEIEKKITKVFSILIEHAYVRRRIFRSCANEREYAGGQSELRHLRSEVDTFATASEHGVSTIVSLAIRPSLETARRRPPGRALSRRCSPSRGLRQDVDALASSHEPALQRRTGGDVTDRSGRGRIACAARAHLPAVLIKSVSDGKTFSLEKSAASFYSPDLSALRWKMLDEARCKKNGLSHHDTSKDRRFDAFQATTELTTMKPSRTARVCAASSRP